MNIKLLTIALVVVVISSCSTSKKNSSNFINTSNLITDFPATLKDGDINVVVEIPSGTLEKWEVSKTNGKIALEHINNKPRIVNYLSYPCNYGMIPRTLLSKKSGGDNDPLDVMVLGEPIARGSVVKCKLIGVLYLTDRGEQDDKLIAVRADTPFYTLNSLEDLKNNYNGVLEILQLWFTNYKGVGKMEFKGFGDREEAVKILNVAIEGYNTILNN